MARNTTANKYADVVYGQRLKTYRPGRVCKWKNCNTILHSFHEGKYCHLHAPLKEMERIEELAQHVYDRDRYKALKATRQRKLEEANAKKEEGLQSESEVLQMVHETACVQG